MMWTSWDHVGRTGKTVGTGVGQAANLWEVALPWEGVRDPSLRLDLGVWPHLSVPFSWQLESSFPRDFEGCFIC